MDDCSVYVRKQMFVMLMTNPKKNKALTLPVVLTTMCASPVGVSIAIPTTGDHLCSEDSGIHNIPPLLPQA